MMSNKNGQREPSIGDIAALSRFFKVSADYLLNIPRGYDYPQDSQ